MPQCQLLKELLDPSQGFCFHTGWRSISLSPGPKALQHSSHTGCLSPQHNCHSTTWQDRIGVQPLPSPPSQSPAPPCTHHPLVPGSEPTGASSSPISGGSGEAMAVLSPTFITCGRPCLRKEKQYKLGWLSTQERGRWRRKRAGRVNRLSQGSLFLTQAVWDRKRELQEEVGEVPTGGVGKDPTATSLLQLSNSWL